MKLVSPHHAEIASPTIVDVARVLDELEERKIVDSESECYVLLEESDTTGAFIQAICVDAYPHWQVEVCNSDEASLRALRDPVTRGGASEMLCRFVQGDRSMGNGQEWMDVDTDSQKKKTTPTIFAVGILAVLAAATGLWLYSR
jgi:hypothetical protein